MQVGITLCAILAGAFGGSTVADQVAVWLMRFPLLAPWADYIAFAGVVGLITFFSLIIGELIPKRIALSNPERLARLVAGPLEGMSRVVSPVIKVLSAATDFLLKPFGLTRRREPPVTDEEVNILIEQGLRAGVFHKAEKEMVEGRARPRPAARSPRS